MFRLVMGDVAMTLQRIDEFEYGSENLALDQIAVGTMV